MVRPQALDKGLPIEARHPFQDLIKRILAKQDQFLPVGLISYFK